MGRDADAIPLADEDRAILALEGPLVAGHTCKVVLLGPGAPDAGALRAAIAARLPAAPMLTRRLGGTADAPAWVPDERFDVDQHVRDADAGAPLDDAALRALVAELFAQRLDRDRPLWRIDVAPRPGGGAALVWRIHHALADGSAAMRYARALLWDPGEDAEGARPHAVSAAAHAAGAAARRTHLAGVLHRELGRSRERSPFDGAIGAERTVAFATLDLHALHDAAKRACGATLNDAVLAVVAGALRAWLQARHGELGDLRARVPVSLHHAADDDAANRDSFFAVVLPLGVADPLDRLRAVHAETAKRKAAHDAEVLDGLLHELGRVSPRLRSFVQRVEQSPRRFAVSVSNVPGPREAVSVLRAPVEALHTLAEIGEHHALRVAAISAGGVLGIGLTADPEIVDGVDELAALLEVEADLLVAAAGA